MSDKVNPKLYYKLVEVEKMTGLSHTFWRKQINTGQLAAIKIGKTCVRIEARELERYFAERRTNGTL